MAILTCTRKKSFFHVAFESDTTMRYAVRIKNALSKILSLPEKNYLLDLSAVEDTDITFIQILIAFNQELKKQNRKMMLMNLPAESGFMIIAAECGIDLHSLFEIKEG